MRAARNAEHGQPEEAGKKRESDGKEDQKGANQDRERHGKPPLRKCFRHVTRTQPAPASGTSARRLSNQFSQVSPNSQGSYSFRPQATACIDTGQY